MIKLTINGQTHDVEAAGDTPLLWVLRDILGMTGTKYGCGMALCGACTVHLDGEPTRSCQLPLSAAAGKAITTIEGLSADRSHPVQRAWMELDVPQCGYCQSGQIISAVDLLSAVKSPTRDEIKQHMSSNLCRCGTYERIVRAVARASKSALPSSRSLRPSSTSSPTAFASAVPLSSSWWSASRLADIFSCSASRCGRCSSRISRIWPR